MIMNDIDDILCREAEQLDPPMCFDAEVGIFCFEDKWMAYYYIERTSHRFVLHYPNPHWETGFYETLGEAHSAACHLAGRAS